MGRKKSDAEGETQSVRRAEEQPAGGEDQPNRTSGSGTARHQYELFSSGSDRTAGAGPLIGGILARLIADKRDRVRECDECLDWYQREKERRLVELADLEQLAEGLFPAADEPTEVELEED